MNTREPDWCHTPLIDDFLITCNLVSAHKNDVTFEWHRRCLILYVHIKGCVITWHTKVAVDCLV